MQLCLLFLGRKKSLWATLQRLNIKKISIYQYIKNQSSDQAGLFTEEARPCPQSLHNPLADHRSGRLYRFGPWNGRKKPKYFPPGVSSYFGNSNFRCCMDFPSMYTEHVRYFPPSWDPVVLCIWYLIWGCCCAWLLAVQFTCFESARAEIYPTKDVHTCDLQDESRWVGWKLLNCLHYISITVSLCPLKPLMLDLRSGGKKWDWEFVQDHVRNRPRVWWLLWNQKWLETSPNGSFEKIAAESWFKDLRFPLSRFRLTLATWRQAMHSAWCRSSWSPPTWRAYPWA